jgi:hypothetical protein
MWRSLYLAMTFKPLALRRWAAHAAFLWLFGLSMGVVNACLAHGGGGLQGPQATLGFHAADASAQHAPCHGGAGDAAGDAGGSSTKSNCQDFCEKAATASPAAKSGLDGGQPQMAPAVARSAIVPMPPRGTVPRWQARRPPVLAPPIRLAFLRLAL